MQKNQRFYTFLLSHTSKSKIYIRPVSISKNFVHSGAIGLILTFGLVSLGFTGFLKNNSATAFNQNEVTAQLSQVQNQPSTEQKSFDYSRPANGENFTINSGGPASPIQIAPLETDSEESEIENQIRTIQTTSNPSNLPTVWAHLGKINNEYGFRRNPFGGRSYEFHGGLDIDGERGDAVIAPANGVVTKAGWQGGYGNLIEVDHGNGLTTRYGHLSNIEIQVGDSVQRGQVIGAVGSTGRSTGPHLHYELRVNDKPINPRRLLPPEPTELKKRIG
jgi:murein DD-endopeptidase MepM/ murein hydrolase activator NlpD